MPSFRQLFNLPAHSGTQGSRADQSEDYGLKTLVGHSDISYDTTLLLDIILVHGSGGHYIRTWRHENNQKDKPPFFWPKDALPYDLPQSQVLSWGHTTNDQSAGRVLDHARGLLADIRANRIGFEGRPIIFVANADGGNIVKEALIVASNGPYRQIKESTTGILFLGTPHRQTKNLDKARIGLRVVHVLGFRTDPVLREISSSDYLADQNDRFKSMLEQTTIKVYSFYENRIRGFPLQGGVMLGADGAIVGSQEEEVMPLEAKWSRLGRFSSRDDANYIRVIHCLRSLAENIITRPENEGFQLDEIKQSSSSKLSKSENAGPSEPNSEQHDELERSIRYQTSDVDSMLAGSPDDGNRPNIPNASSQHDSPSSGSAAPQSPSDIKNHSVTTVVDATNANMFRDMEVASLSSQQKHNIAPLIRGKNISTPSQMNNVPTRFPPSEMQYVPSAPRSNVHDTHLLWDSIAMNQAIAETAGWTVAEKAAVANAVIGGTLTAGGLGLASANAIIAGKSLAVATKGLDKSSQSAAAGKKSAKYSKKTYRRNYGNHRRDPHRDSSYTSDTSDSSSTSKNSKSQFGGKATARAKRLSKTQKVYQNNAQQPGKFVTSTDIERQHRIQSLPRPPTEIHNQSELVSHEQGLHGNKDGTSHTIAYFSSGDAASVCVEGQHYQHTVPERQSTEGSGGTRDERDGHREEKPSMSASLGISDAEDHLKSTSSAHVRHPLENVLLDKVTLPRKHFGQATMPPSPMHGEGKVDTVDDHPAENPSESSHERLSKYHGITILPQSGGSTELTERDRLQKLSAGAPLQSAADDLPGSGPLSKILPRFFGLTRQNSTAGLSHAVLQSTEGEGEPVSSQHLKGDFEMTMLHHADQQGANSTAAVVNPDLVRLVSENSSESSLHRVNSQTRSESPVKDLDDESLREGSDRNLEIEQIKHFNGHNEDSNSANYETTEIPRPETEDATGDANRDNSTEEEDLKPHTYSTSDGETKMEAQTYNLDDESPELRCEEHAEIQEAQHAGQQRDGSMTSSDDLTNARQHAQERVVGGLVGNRIVETDQASPTYLINSRNPVSSPIIEYTKANGNGQVSGSTEDLTITRNGDVSDEGRTAATMTSDAL